jgi:hypothetical protein
MDFEMKRTMAPLFLAALVALAAPASAGGLSLDLPRLSFPGTGSDAPSQGCTTPGTLSGSACQGAAG